MDKWFLNQISYIIFSYPLLTPRISTKKKNFELPWNFELILNALGEFNSHLKNNKKKIIKKIGLMLIFWRVNFNF
jgi:hypothetical protein